MVENNAAYTASGVQVASTVKQLDLPTGPTPARVYITVEVAAIRWRYDGKDPVAGIGGGHLASDGDEFTLEGTTNVKNFRFIADTGTAAMLFYSVEAI